MECIFAMDIRHGITKMKFIWKYALASEKHIIVLIDRIFIQAKRNASVIRCIPSSKDIALPITAKTAHTLLHFQDRLPITNSRFVFPNRHDLRSSFTLKNGAYYENIFHGAAPNYHFVCYLSLFSP